LVNDILEKLAGGARREDEDEEENIEEEEVLELAKLLKRNWEEKRVLKTLRWS